MSLLRKIAFPISLVYGFVVYLRNKFYDLGVFSSEDSQTITICVGNLSVGGTGKTPMIESLIRYLELDYKVAVLSRGYMRKSKGHVVASQESTFEDLGDEPYQIHSKFPKISLAVNTNRRDGISQLEKAVEPDVILLDDAFQHRKVQATFNILLTSYDKLYVNDWYLPTGNLRDSKSQSKRAHCIIVTKCPKDISKAERKMITETLGLNRGQELLFSYLKYDLELYPRHDRILLHDLKGVHFTLVTGIANPEPLLDYLKGESLIFDHLDFKDHHFFSAKEIELFNSKNFILTTEKDYVRLKGKVNNLHFITIRHVFDDTDEKRLKNMLKHLMG